MGRLRVMVGEDMRPETSKKRVQGDTKGTEFSPAFHLRSRCRIGRRFKGRFCGIMKPCFSQNSGETASSVWVWFNKSPNACSQPMGTFICDTRWGGGGASNIKA